MAMKTETVESTTTEESAEVAPVFELELIEIRTPGPLKQQGN